MQFHNNSDFYDRISEVMFQEIPLWSMKGGGYAGRMDLSIWGKPRIPKVIDFKTSRRPKKEEWIDGYKMQTAAYSVALHEQHGIFPESTEIWISCETGEVQMFEMDRSQIKYYFEKFHEMVVEYHKLYN
jgi:CRISPR/Cas system-associated exonuclease Cas4 (RecB family)